MPSFAYKGRDKKGTLKSGVLEGESSSAVAVMLSNLGLVPVEIKPYTGEKTGEIQFSLPFKPKVTITDLIIFSRQMYSLTRAGVPLNRAIAILKESNRNQTMAETLKSIEDSLDQGNSLSVSMEAHPKVFSKLIISLVQVGENTGRLDEVFKEVSIYLEREQETIRRIKAALRYPIMVMTAITIAVVVINIWVIPPFAELFKKYDKELPMPTQIIIGTSNFMIAYWPYLLLLTVGFIMTLRMYVKTEQGEYYADRFKLKIPKIGEVITRATLSRFAGTFSMLLRSGVPLIQGLWVTSYAVDNAYLGRHIRGMRSEIERGETLAKTARNTGLFDSLVVQMIAIGEETGHVDELLNEVSSHYERDVDYDLKRLSDAIEPMLIVLIGVIVLILALGVFLPLWRLGSVLG